MSLWLLIDSRVLYEALVFQVLGGRENPDVGTYLHELKHFLVSGHSEDLGMELPETSTDGNGPDPDSNCPDPPGSRYA